MKKIIINDDGTIITKTLSNEEQAQVTAKLIKTFDIAKKSLKTVVAKLNNILDN